MTKAEFEQRLLNVTNFLIAFTKTYCFNDFSSNITYLITPNTRNAGSHLSSFEILVLTELNKLGKRHLSSKEVVELLYRDGKVPLWINITIYQTTKQLTVVDLCTSRRLRNDSELNHLADQYPPFHPLVPIPPDSLRVERDGKYDINYQKRLEKLQLSKSLTKRILSFFGKKYGG